MPIRLQAPSFVAATREESLGSARVPRPHKQLVPRRTPRYACIIAQASARLGMHLECKSASEFYTFNSQHLLLTSRRRVWINVFMGCDLLRADDVILSIDILDGQLLKR